MTDSTSSAGQAPPICVLVPAQAGAKLAWAVEELLARLGLPYRAVSDGRALPAGAAVLAVGADVPAGASGLSIRASGPGDALGLSRLLASGGAESLVTALGSPSRLALAIDLADAMEFWLGSRDSYAPPHWDEVGRAEFSTLSAAGLAGAPVVDLLAEMVHDRLRRAAGSGGLLLPRRRLPWPDGAAFAAHLSHDMDSLGGRYQIWRRYAAWAGRWALGSLRGSPDASRHLRKIKRWWNAADDPEYTVPRILDVEGRHGATSSFYFFCNRGASTRGQSQARMYRIRDRLAREAVGLIVRAGSEVGVHGTFCTYTSGREMRRQKELLQEVSGGEVAGIRQHWLRLHIPRTWQAQNEAGFVYDATLGWNDAIGFRAGTCRPFRLWDCLMQRPIGMYELPLSLQDVALAKTFGDAGGWVDRVTPVIDRVQSLGGLAGVLLHPDHMDDVEFPRQGRYYDDLLTMLRARGACCRSGREIISAEDGFRRSLIRP